MKSRISTPVYSFILHCIIFSSCVNIYIFKIIFFAFLPLLKSLQCSVKSGTLQIRVLTTRLRDALSIWQNLEKLYCTSHRYTLPFLELHRLGQRRYLQLQGTRWHICHWLALKITASIEDVLGLLYFSGATHYYLTATALQTCLFDTSPFMCWFSSTEIKF